MFSYFLAIFFVWVSYFLSLEKRSAVELKVLCQLSVMLSFVITYVSVNDKLAQDRVQYYIWYERAAYFLMEPEGRDRLFTLCLDFLPKGMSADAFGIFFSSLFILVTISVVYGACKRGVVQWDIASIALVGVLCDRVFLDAACNTTRSSLASMLFLLGIGQRKFVAGGLLVAVAFGFHGRIAAMLLGIYFLARFVILNRWLLMPILVAGLSAFMFRFFSGSAVFAELSVLDGILGDAESQSIARGISLSAELTVNIAIQLVIGLVVPLVLWLINSMREENNTAQSDERKFSDVYIRFMLLSLSLGFLFYPDLMLFQRLFVLPLLGLLFFLPRKQLAIFVFVKAAIFTVVMPSYF